MTRRIIVATSLVVTVTLVVGVGVTWMLRERVRADAVAEMARQVEVTAGLIEEDLVDLDLGPGRDSIRKLQQGRASFNRSMERARIIGGHDVVEAVLNVRGRQIAISEPLVILPSVPAVSTTTGVTTIDTENGSLHVAVEALPVNPGELVVAIARSEPLYPTAQVMWGIAAALLVGSTLTIGLAVWFRSTVRRRLEEIEEAASEVGSGNLTARVPTQDDEIGRVAEAFNVMTADLAESRTRERNFLMAIGHDLRTPLTTIRGYAEALDDGLVDPEQLEGVASSLHRQTDVLTRLVEDVTLLAHVESDQFELRFERVDVVALTIGTVESFRHRTEDAGIDLAVDASGAASVDLDPDRYVQIVGNLMENAIRYTPSGGRVRVEISASDTVRLTIRNTGPGIAAQDLPHVFERLYVADRYRAERPVGSGLGLAIVRDLVDAFDGTVSCRSSSKETVFTVTLEVKRPASHSIA